jgi:hypothetical protein
MWVGHWCVYGVDVSLSISRGCGLVVVVRACICICIGCLCVEAFVHKSMCVQETGASQMAWIWLQS